MALGLSPTLDKEENRMESDDLQLVVTSRRMASETVVELELAAATGERLPGWEPGSHLDLVLADGMVRQYSLCADDPGDHSGYRIAVLLEPESRGGSAYVHDKLWSGVEVVVRGPRNRFPLEEAPRYLFIAGGVGITPIKPMLAQAEQSGSAWSLYYGGRSADTMAFADDLAGRYGERVVLRPQDEHGMLDLDGILADIDENTLVYCCGPTPLIDAVESLCAERCPGQLRTERFTAAPVDTGGDQPFVIEVSGTGQVVEVGADESALDALEAAGVDIPWSCREGVCGTCQVPVLSGTVEHRDEVLTEDERASQTLMHLCVSRAVGEGVVIDV
ncbi:PDR/VanB family oxidoreductase [Nocardioides sp. YJ-D4]